MSDRPEDAGRGALFKNDKREKDTHPLYKGDCTILINGKPTKFWISAWLKEGKAGKYMSLSFREAERRTDDRDRQQPDRDHQRPLDGNRQRGSGLLGRDSDIPFGPELR